MIAPINIIRLLARGIAGTAAGLGDGHAPDHHDSLLCGAIDDQQPGRFHRAAHRLPRRGQYTMIVNDMIAAGPPQGDRPLGGEAHSAFRGEP